MRVLRVIPTIDPDVGGPSNSAVNAALAESRSGVQTTMVFTGDAGSLNSTAPARARLEAAGVRTLMFPRPALLSRQAGLWGVSPALTVWILRHVGRFEVVHIHYVWALTSVLAAFAGRRHRKLVVLTAHESLTRYDIDTASGSSFKRQLKLALRRIIMRRVDTVVCASALEQQDSLLPGEDGVVISHPVVETPRLAPVEEPAGGPFTVGYLGRLHPKKNVELLLRAMERLPATYRLVICGDGDPVYRDRLHDLASKAGLDDRVSWRGHVNADGRSALFREVHLLAMPSAYECFGMAAAEALASGVPVVVSDSTGLAPLIAEFDAGIVVPTGDVDALVAALARLAEEGRARQERRQAAVSATALRLSFEAYGNAIVQIYAGRNEVAQSAAPDQMSTPVA